MVLNLHFYRPGCGRQLRAFNVTCFDPRPLPRFRSKTHRARFQAAYQPFPSSRLRAKAHHARFHAANQPVPSQDSARTPIAHDFMRSKQPFHSQCSARKSITHDFMRPRPNVSHRLPDFFLLDAQAVLVSILPIVPAYIICWPWALTLVLHGRWVGVALAMSQYLIFSLIDTELYAQVRKII